MLPSITSMTRRRSRSTRPVVYLVLVDLVADNVPALIAAFDARDNRCQFANAGYARTFGLTEQSILGRTFEEVIGVEAARLIEPHVAVLSLHRRAAR